MRIRMTTALSGPYVNLVAGDVVDYDDDAEAQRFVDAGLAEVVDDEPTPAKRGRKAKVETASAGDDDVETAAAG